VGESVCVGPKEPYKGDYVLPKRPIILGGRECLRGT